MSKRISKYVSYHEGVRSVTALRRGIRNIPDAKIIKRMRAVAKKVFDPVRAHFGVPIRVNSFYRSVKLNSAIGGSRWSQHCRGEAIDVDAINGTGLTNKQIFNYIRKNLDFDKLISEFPDKNGNPAWVHVSFKEGKGKNRKLVYEAYHDGRRTAYRRI